MIPWLNGLAAGLALLLACLAGIDLSPPAEARVKPPAKGTRKLELVRLRDGSSALVDASGEKVPLGDYQRIVSGSSIADALLLELAAPNRVVAYSNYSDASPLGAYRFLGKPHIDPLDNLEELLALKPDLLFLSTHGDPAKVARLRDAGLQIFNLGEMRGLSTYLDNALEVSALLGAPERGQDYAEDYMGRMLKVAPDIPEGERSGAVFLVVFSGKMFGGGRHTSYDDVMHHAGLRNLAAAKYDGWPQYDPEQVLELDPEFIVTRDNMRRSICSQPGLEGLRACERPELHIIELPAPLISSAGAGMLPAAQKLRAAVETALDSRP